MCFTINIHTTRNAIEKRFQADAGVLKDYEYRYFFKAFDQPWIPVISQDNPEKVKLAQWGLIPQWAKDEEHAEKIRKGTYNARAESLATKPSFRESFQTSRCWIIVQGFYEWQHLNNSKIPWYIQLKNGGLFALAGLTSAWNDPQKNDTTLTCSIVTSPANSLMEKIHNSKKRMPLILDEKEEMNWLTAPDHALIDDLLKPFDQEKMEAYTISRTISSKAADPLDPHILDRVDYGRENTLF